METNEEPLASRDLDAAEPPPTVFIVGAGVVGTAVAARLVEAGVQVLGLHGRDAERTERAGALAGVPPSSGTIPEVIGEADVVIISVRDEGIREVADGLLKEKRLRPHQVLLHTSGANVSSDILGAAKPHVRAVGTLHPLVSFADARLAIEGMKRVTFGIEGDAEARRVAHHLVAMLGAYAVDIAAENLALYHVGAVLVSNYLVALADLGRGLLVEAGVPEETALPALIPLMTSVVQNLAQVGLPAALTGPVARGDVSSVARHIETLSDRAPDLLPLYRTMGKQVLRLAHQKSPLDPATAAKLEILFTAPDTK